LWCTHIQLAPKGMKKRIHSRMTCFSWTKTSVCSLSSLESRFSRNIIAGRAWWFLCSHSRRLLALATAGGTSSFRRACTGCHLFRSAVSRSLSASAGEDLVGFCLLGCDVWSCCCEILTWQLGFPGHIDKLISWNDQIEAIHFSSFLFATLGARVDNF
jgi:hypothetical protein